MGFPQHIKMSLTEKNQTVAKLGSRKIAQKKNKTLKRRINQQRTINVVVGGGAGILRGEGTDEQGREGGEGATTGWR